ncbi:MAG TPA: ABC transporter ATP-binding protein [Reyranella sp.]|jgi:putative ABC transport system ATP-binding protein|nr:ABC transporter ATP-binding protein [Reyranella sp.]
MQVEGAPSVTEASGTTAREPGAASASSLVSVSRVDYTLTVGGAPLQILRNVSLEVAPAEVVAIVGPSGSGKTSLLMLLGGLERPTAGKVVIAGQDLTGLSEDALAAFRRNTLGIVFQSFYLIPSLSALDNVSLALEIAQPELSLAKARERSAAALAAVGLGDRMHHRPTAMSGGEQQRVGLARAIIAVPKLLLADEPTGNLDQNTGAQVIRLMFDLARQQGAAVVFVTHDPALAARADRVLTMTRGELTEDRK